MSTRGRDLQVNQATYVKYEKKIFFQVQSLWKGKQQKMAHKESCRNTLLHELLHVQIVWSEDENQECLHEA